MRDSARTVLANGVDPRTYQQQERDREEAVNQNTFAKVASDWYEVKKSLPLAANTIKDIWCSLEKYVIPFVGNVPVSEIVDHNTYCT